MPKREPQPAFAFPVWCVMFLLSAGRVPRWYPLSSHMTRGAARKARLAEFAQNRERMRKPFGRRRYKVKKFNTTEA